MNCRFNSIKTTVGKVGIVPIAAVPIAAVAIAAVPRDAETLGAVAIEADAEGAIEGEEGARGAVELFSMVSVLLAVVFIVSVACSVFHFAAC